MPGWTLSHAQCSPCPNRLILMVPPAAAALSTSASIASPSSGSSVPLPPIMPSTAVPQVVRHFEEFVCSAPEISVPVASIKALTRHIETSPAGTMTEFTKDLETALSALLTASKNCVAVCAGCELFRRFVNRTGSDSSEDLAAFKTRLIDKGNLFVERAGQCRDRIARRALEFIQDDSTVLVHSYSRVVLNLLVKAAGDNRRFRVYVTESRPNARGVRAARLLRQHGIPTTVILDSAAGHYMGRADLVLVGAEGVVENGGIVNQVGTFMLAVMAKAVGVPFYAVVESYKFVRCFPLGQYDLPSLVSSTCLFPAQMQLHGGSAMVAEQDREMMEPEHPSVDYTPPDYISLLFTDIGILTPSGVSDELIKLYY